MTARYTLRLILAFLFAFNNLKSCYSWAAVPHLLSPHKLLLPCKANVSKPCQVTALLKSSSGSPWLLGERSESLLGLRVHPWFNPRVWSSPVPCVPATGGYFLILPGPSLAPYAVPSSLIAVLLHLDNVSSQVSHNISRKALPGPHTRLGLSTVRHVNLYFLLWNSFYTYNI